MTATAKAPGLRLSDILASWVTRAGLRFLLITDVVMIGILAQPFLASAGIAYSLAGPVYTVAQGFLLGSLIQISAMRPAPRDIALVVRDGLIFGTAIAMVLLLVCQAGPQILVALGQSPEIARQGGPILALLGLGLPLHFAFVGIGFVLEALGQRQAVALWVGGGFMLNIAMNLALPSLSGHEPEATIWAIAWATLALRCLLLFGIVRELLKHVQASEFLALPSWRRDTGRKLRRIGLAAGAGIAIESAAFAALSIFAGWLGPQALAAYTMLISLISVIFSLALAVAIITAGRIAAEPDMPRRRYREGLVTALILMSILSLLAYLARAPLIALGLSEPGAAAIALPLIAFVGVLMLGDGGQTVAMHALRAIGDAWPATWIHLACYLTLMVGGGWLLALPLERGIRGLLEATAIASFTTLALLTWRFLRLTQKEVT